MSAFSFARVWALMIKEFIQMRRDRLTFGMMIGVPIVQLVLFGFAINSDPKHLPTAVAWRDPGPYARAFVAALENSEYYRIVGIVTGEDEGRRLLAAGDVSFVVTIPEDFDRRLLRGETPVVLVEADASDPVAAGNAIGALDGLRQRALALDLVGPLARLAPGPPAFDIVVHRRFNPEGITAYNIIPGLLGVILTMTMILMTAMGVTRELERGTMETLLSLPLRPGEVMLGKIAPYVLIGGVQVAVVLLAARYVFLVPMAGSLWLLLLGVLVFVVVNLAIGFTFSTLARNQLQAMQMTFFFFLPSILLSGFMFPFRGMPQWAQLIGELFPLTHFLRIVRGVMLKGSVAVEIWPNIWPLLLIGSVATAIALLRYRRTLD